MELLGPVQACLGVAIPSIGALTDLACCTCHRVSYAGSYDIAVDVLIFVWINRSLTTEGNGKFCVRPNHNSQ